MAIHNIYKPLGWTPLEALQRFKDIHPEFANESMTYAGRLDPMAEGVIILLSGNDLQKKDEFMGLNKTYEATALLGFYSDTYDALGVVHEGMDIDKSLVEPAIQNLLGVQNLPYPAYSSYRVQGKPLVWWARTGQIHKIQIPIKGMGVLSLDGTNIFEETSSNLVKELEERIKLVRGDFRQDKIIKLWKFFLEKEKSYTMATFSAEVTSGTYIRSLVHYLGKELGCGSILYHLKRTSVGTYTADDAEKL